MFARMPESVVPFDGSYWVMNRSLLAGPYPGSLDKDVTDIRLRSLLECGIRHIIDLTEGHEVFYYSRGLAHYEDHLLRIAQRLRNEIRIVNFPIVDMDVPSRPVMVRILDDIDRAITQGDPVYIHCWGGLGRTGTVVGCYLARHNLACGDAALEKIFELRRNSSLADYPSPQTSAQREMIRSWQAGE
jgi:hypothetical protein